MVFSCLEALGELFGAAVEKDDFEFGASLAENAAVAFFERGACKNKGWGDADGVGDGGEPGHSIVVIERDALAHFFAVGSRVKVIGIKKGDA